MTRGRLSTSREPGTGRGAKRAALLNLTLLAAALLVGAAALEGFLRLFPQFLPETAQVRLMWAEVGAAERAARGGMIRTDPELGFRYAPDHAGRIARADLAFSFRTDSHGFRNAGPWPQTSEIVLVGDSMAFGYGVEDEEAWASLVRREMGGGLVNLALPGMAPQQYLRALEAYGLGLQPKLVLFALFPGNDLVDAANFQGWLDADRPGSYLDWGFRDRSGGLESVLEHSHLFWFLRESRRMLGARAGSVTLQLDDGPLQLAPALYAPSDEELGENAPSFNLVVQTVERAQRLADRHGADFLVLLVPTKEHVYLPAGEDDPLPRIERLARALAARGIDTLDLTPALREAARRGERVYFEIDGHPNRRGNELIARAVTERLQARPPAGQALASGG
ncbi:alginate O-acetyltransferase AlgX-related protein [Marinimicrococcus flavescens]|uniref:AlgX/AlgJ SGNH hydrolase-like domain-containing protein n=1 Tax=Marinimicrococcus flavescens TaxID=3031815 RepID=A0AAP3UZF0_9PROT|nr:hypothetical protein [Marinimicrococcus flavescens]